MKTSSLSRTQMQRGFSTLELLIAFAVLTLSISAVIMVAFGNQSVAVDTELAQRALYLAERNLEEAGATAKNAGFVALSDTFAVDGLYSATTTVSDDRCFKLISTEVGWNRDQRSLSTTLATVLSDSEVSAFYANDCATSPVGDAWDNPTSFDIQDVIGSGDQGTDVDIVVHPEGVFAFLTSEQAANKGDLWIIDITDIDNLDEDSVIATSSSAANYRAIDSYVDKNTNIIYSFVASAAAAAELQVVTTTFPPAYPNQPPVIQVVQSFDLPRAATDVKYLAGKVFVSTEGSNSNEFFTYDETSPGFLVADQVADAGNNITVNSFDVAGEWAYLATSHNSREIIAFKFESPANKFYFDASGSADASSIYSSDQYTYLGRVRDSGNDDFFIVRNSDIQDNASPSDGLVGSVDMDDELCTRKNGNTLTTKSCLGPNTEIVGMSIHGNLAFLLTNENNAEFQIWDVSSKSNIQPHTGCNAYDFPANPAAIDFPGKIAYTGYPEGRELGFLAVRSNDALRVIYDQAIPDICTE